MNNFHRGNRMDHKYNYSITKQIGEVMTMVDTDDRSFAYEFVHGIPEIVAQPVNGDTVRSMIDECAQAFKENFKG